MADAGCIGSDLDSFSRVARPLFAAVACGHRLVSFGSAGAGTATNSQHRLIEVEQVLWKFYGQLYEQETLGRLRLRGTVLERVRVELNGRLAHTHIRLSDFEETGAVASDTEDLVNLCLTIKGTDAAMILVEQTPDVYKVSFRSRCELDCSELARQFGAEVIRQLPVLGLKVV